MPASLWALRLSPCFFGLDDGWYQRFGDLLIARRHRRQSPRSDNPTGRYAGHQASVESNVYQRTVDYPDEWHNGHHVMLDSEKLVTVRWEQVRPLDDPGASRL